MMNYFLILCLILVVGCAATEKKKTDLPPSVSTTRVIDSLTDLKADLAEAGEDNAKLDKNIDNAITLAEKLNAVLAKIEQEQLAMTNQVTPSP